jgi:uncharacterized DUF497 family protein
VSKLAFEWDKQKAESNLTSHGVTFDEASTAFYDPLAQDLPDNEHSTVDEVRSILIGKSDEGRLLYVCFTERHGRVRIISARLVTRRERLNYEEGT